MVNTFIVIIYDYMILFMHDLIFVDLIVHAVIGDYI